VNQNRIQGDYYYMLDIETPASGEYYGASYYVSDNEQCATEAATFSTNAGTLPIFAPETPIETAVGINQIDENLIVLGAYPNPIENHVTLQFYLHQIEDLEILVYDISGKQVFRDNITRLNQGINYMQLNLESLDAGTYHLVLQNSIDRASKKIIKIK